MFAQAATSHHDKNKSAQRVRSDYDPSRDGDGTGEQDLIDGNAKEKTSYMPPGGGVVKFKNCKRVIAAEPCTRVTRSKKTITKPVPSVNQAAELSGTYNECAQAAIEDDGLALPDDNAHMTENTERHNHMDNEGDSNQHGDENENTTMAAGDRDLTHGDENENATMAAGDRDITHPDDQMIAAGGRQGIRRGTMGHGLQRMNRARRGRLQIVINEGSIRPVVPLVAAKWATECNIAVRTHVPVLKHWKDYKDKHAYLEMFMGCLRTKFHIDTSDETIKKACREMMKKAVRQQRYKLKKKFFVPFPLHRVSKTSPVKCMTDKLHDLVESWKSPKKMETCQMNKFSRGNVKSHKKIGSRSYEVFVENNLEDKYKDEEPNAIDLFKECHYNNKTKGFTPQVQSIITQMETVLATHTEGEDPKSAEQVVVEVLGEKSKFLQNVGICPVLPRASRQNSQAELEAERRANAELRALVNTQRMQIDDLSKKQQETQEQMAKDREMMNKKQADLDAKLEAVLNRQVH